LLLLLLIHTRPRIRYSLILLGFLTVVEIALVTDLCTQAAVAAAAATPSLNVENS